MADRLEFRPPDAALACPCCGGTEFAVAPVIWKGLAEEWRLSPEEWRLVDEQQGGHCRRCGTNLRSQALAAAMMKVTGFQGLFVQYGEWMAARGLQVLEINPAGSLTRFLAGRPGHRLATYPDVDMMAMPYAGGSFDLVIHSDTLEHVRHPVRALAECRRVLKPGGHCVYTVPLLPGRLTLSREGMPPSYHGSPGAGAADYVVWTEYGADAWRQALEAGFGECRIMAHKFPSALALAAAA
ncbi:MAG: class I SAM-dependent methyltransferase [Rhodocyclaceae bacterium]|nr:class I SAM-dependent methyltransferase [Rhodocyclaceae bacterium]